MPARLAILLSGSGRTFLNLHERIRAGELDARIRLVIASRKCLGGERARTLGITTRVLPGEIPAEKLAETLSETQTDVVLCAGYLRKVHVPESFKGRVLNIHPAPLSILDDTGAPRFGGPGLYGRHVHEAVLAAHHRGELTESGCTVHHVTSDYDRGPIILERRCPIEAGDTPDTLADRVFALERETYPDALKQFLTNTPA